MHDGSEVPWRNGPIPRNVEKIAGLGPGMPRAGPDEPVVSATPELVSSQEAPDRLLARGEWLLDHVSDPVAAPSGSVAGEIDATDIDRLDSAGALALLDQARTLGLEPRDIRFRPEHQALVDAILATREHPTPETRGPRWPGPTEVLGHVGRAMSAIGANLVQLTGFLGLVLVTLASVLRRPRQLQFTSIVHHMEETGLNALPLVALLSFLVGAVIAFLGATVLRAFGAEMFVVDLTVFAFLREFGVLLTAILLAGRTASAFAAQIGTMKSREEIDAMRTMGLDPVTMLVLPRLMALLIVLPLLTVIAMVAGLAGGLMVAVVSLDMGAEMFINRMFENLQLNHYLVGLVKAPVFAFVIALVGCLEGFKVEGTAQSVGERTTSAVVQSITLVIVLDALAAVFFMEMGW